MAGKLEKELAERVEKYRKLTYAALEKIKITADEGTEDYERAEDFLMMAQSYFSDAEHFEKEGKMLLALAAYSYAHAWLDALARAGFADFQGDSTLFAAE